MDYASLRAEGIRQLERMAGGQWTDFNAHDPGITILEQLCYALTDIGYRTAHPIPDLLAEGGRDPHESLHGPAEILGSCPVTPADLRRLVLDVEGVRNAWIVPLQADTLPLYHHPGGGELSLSEQPAPSDPVAIKGLYRVIIDAEELMGTRVRAEVVGRLHANRGLCEDFVEIKVLDPQLVTVDATVEIGSGEDAEAMHAEILRRLADAVSPTVAFTTLEELLRAGRPLDEIFEGPRLEHGFILDEALERTLRREAINISDVVRTIMDVSGVRAVSSVNLAAGGAQPEQWSLAIPEGTVARLDEKRSLIRLRRAGKVVFPRPQPAVGGPPVIGARDVPRAAPAAVGSLPLATGRDRGVAEYMSVQQQFPAVYGIGEMGLPSTATPARRAQARQLQAYLMIFDQLMANHLAQLAHVKDLLALDGEETHTYFAQTVDGPGLGVAAIRPTRDEREVLYQSLGSIEDIDSERRGRFLSHLLARFGEVIDDHGTSTLAELARSRQAFLRRAPRLGGARGTGFDYLGPSGEGNRSGLEERVRLKLGLTAEEACVVVEHVLLRPMEGDREQQSPLLAAVKYRDPYSLQLTFVFKDGVGRFDDKDSGVLRALVEETVRAETPAHIAPRLLWLKDPAFSNFVAAHEVWLSRRRTYHLEGLARHIPVRSARDRVIDLLGLGETYPLTDVPVTADKLTVNFDGPSAFRIEPGQIDVRYELQEHGKVMDPPCTVVGTVEKIVLTGPPIKQDRTFQISATKLDRPARSVVLSQSATVKVGFDTGLRVYFAGTGVVDVGDVVEVKIERSQEGALYQLAYADADGTPVLTSGAMGTGGELRLFTKPVAEDTQIRVKVTRTFDPSEGRANMSDFLATMLALVVRINPGVGVAIAGSPLVDDLGAAIVVANSQRSVMYSVLVRPLRDADFAIDRGAGVPVLVVAVPAAPPDVAGHEVLVRAPSRPFVMQDNDLQPGEIKRGNGGELHLALGPLGEDSVIVIQAHKDETVIPLKQAVVALARPNPAPGLKLTLAPGVGGPNRTLRVEGGQRGVFYHFRRAGETTELGRPAYFHRLDEVDPSSNHGIEKFRVEVDFVVIRDASDVVDPSRQLPLDVLVDVENLAALAPGETLTLDVMAVRARTGVGWALPRQIIVTRSP